MINVLFNDYKYDLVPKKKETYEKYCKILKWGRQNPVAFIETFMNIQLLDHQKYVFLSSWTPATVVWLMSRSSGKSYLTSPFIMARSLLIPNHNTYIMAPAGNQAQLNFQKLEDLAKGQIASVLGVSSFFLDECVRLNAKADPFTHSKQSYTVGLYNGSTINTLNSVAKNIVGVRSNLSVFDEAGKIDRDFYALTEPFSVQDSSFVTGGNLNPELYPTQLPNKNLYLSSAEGQDSHLFDMYKRGFERMLHGDPDYFVCDLDCQLSLHPFLCGKPTKPLVSQQTIDDAFATNKYRAQREYYNLWDNDSGPNAFIKKSTINKYTQVYWPILENEGEKHYIILYDPASKNDNSFVLVCEIIRDEERGLMLKLVYARNLVEPLANGQKAHIQKPEQVEILKELLLKYNLTFDDYEGIDILCIDAGAGGLKLKLPRKVIYVIKFIFLLEILVKYIHYNVNMKYG